MSLATILYPSPTASGADEWFHANFQHHQSIVGALKDVRGVILPVYQIFPANPQNMQIWLREHQHQHNEMCNALGISGTDLSSVDFRDKKQLDAWYFAHFLEHQAAAAASGLPI